MDGLKQVNNIKILLSLSEALFKQFIPFNLLPGDESLRELEATAAATIPEPLHIISYKSIIDCKFNIFTIFYLFINFTSVEFFLIVRCNTMNI